MLTEFTTIKLLYDLTIALITGIFAGVVVDYLIRRREERRWSLTKSLMYATIVDIFTELIKDALPPGFYEITAKIWRFSDIAFSLVLVELKDANVCHTEHNSELTNQIAESLKAEQLKADMEMAAHGADKLPVIAPSKLPGLNALIKAKEQLDDVFQKYGSLMEPKLRASLGKFYDQESIIVNFTNSRDRWEHEDSQLFARLMVAALRMANTIRSSLSKKAIKISDEL